MPRGGARRNKTRRQRELDGSRKRPRHEHHKEPEPDLGRPPKPDDLPDVASKKWDELAAIMEAEGRLTVSDGPWLEVTAVAYAEYRRWFTLAAASELTVVTDRGEEKTHPAQQQMRLAWESYRKLLGEGGLTPTSRARVNAGSAGDDYEDEFEKHQKQGGLHLVKPQAKARRA